MADQQLNISNETWKPIVDFPGYEVSNKGRVRSYWRFKGGPGNWHLANTPQRNLKPRKTYSSLAKNRNKPSHRFTVSLRNAGEKPRSFNIGRLVLAAFVGPCPEGLECCHRNDHPEDNRVENLRWDNRKSNMEDKVRNGNSAKGTTYPFVKLTEVQVREIRHLYQSGLMTRKGIASHFKICKTHVRSIIKGEKWLHLR